MINNIIIIIVSIITCTAYLPGNKNLVQVSYQVRRQNPDHSKQNMIEATCDVCRTWEWLHKYSFVLPRHSFASAGSPKRRCLSPLSISAILGGQPGSPTSPHPPSSIRLLPYYLSLTYASSLSSLPSFLPYTPRLYYLPSPCTISLIRIFFESHLVFNFLLHTLLYFS